MSLVFFKPGLEEKSQIFSERSSSFVLSKALWLSQKHEIAKLYRDSQYMNFCFVNTFLKMVDDSYEQTLA